MTSALQSSHSVVRISVVNFLIAALSSLEATMNSAGSASEKAFAQKIQVNQDVHSSMLRLVAEAVCSSGA